MFFTNYNSTINTLQAQSDSNTMTIAVSSLTAGTNVIYVNMQTSDSCYIALTAQDSIVLINPQGGMPPVDTSSTDGIFLVGPNPFAGDLVISGFNPARSYNVSLLNSVGQVALGQVLQGQKFTALMTASLVPGIYYLRVTDTQTGRVVFSKTLLRAN
jgi:hypothetical protein